MADDSFALTNLEEYLTKKVDFHEVLRARYTKNDENEFSLSIRFAESEDFAEITDHIKSLSSVKRVEVLTGKSTSEY